MMTVVIKYGGAAMHSPELMRGILHSIAELKKVGLQPIIVHGGGPEISKMSQKMGIVSQFIDGLRVTDTETIEIVQMVLAGKINKELVSQLNREGAPAVGLSGIDSNLLVARKLRHPSGKDLGYVGELLQVNTKVLSTLMDAGYIPVIAPIASSEDYCTLNVNADSAASGIAAAIKADHLIFLSDVAGILKKPQDPSTKIDVIRSGEIADLVATRTITGGMIPKAEGALAALNEGVGEVHLLDGRVADSLSLYFCEGKRLGTTFKPI